MNIWVNKVVDETPSADYSRAYIFTLNHQSKGTMYTSLKDVWLDIGKQPIDSIYEDLFVIAMSIFAVDKRVSRWRTTDKWTRNINISIPVLNLEKWEGVRALWSSTLSFLTGDIWNVKFRTTNARYGDSSKPSKNPIDISKSTAVCLFSGGLDSFCGAIELLNRGESICLLGHNEYPKLREKQEYLRDLLRTNYPHQFIEFIDFTANSRAPINTEGVLLRGTENTCRGRSLLFLGAAVSIAGALGPAVPVYIPENGFIGLNIPLTNSRKGTCSTRTTHPHFIRSFNRIIQSVGIDNPVENFFAYKTKREVVNQVKDSLAFKEGADKTISCSHPCLPRWKKDGDRTYPKNCGYCYPCLIRKSCLQDIILNDNSYSYNSISLDFLKRYSAGSKINDLNAVINSVYRYIHSDDSELRRLIMCTGSLTGEEIEAFLHVYKSTMDNLITMFSQDYEMRNYIGLGNE
ncbi:MAG: Qat anti-phage system QueC-like protein QatC [Caulobacteraceae bacterium]